MANKGNLLRRAIANGKPVAITPSNETRHLSHNEKREWRLLKDLSTGNYAKIASYGVRKSSLAEESGLAGGYLTPLYYSNELLDSIEETAFIEPHATIVPMFSKDTVCPKPNFETANAANIAPWFGGVQFTWANSTTLAESEPTFHGLTLTAHDLLGYLVLSNQFISDIGEEGEKALIRLLGRAASWYKEYAFINGTGTSTNQPLGILNAPGTAVITRTTPGGGHIVQADIANLAANLLPHSWNTARWICSPRALGDVMKITSFIPNQNMDGLENGCAGALMGRPLHVTSKLPTLGSTGDICLIDPKFYVIGQRQDVVIEASQHPNFKNFQTIFRVWKRCDGKPLNS